ncbi:MAG: ATP phosphoribosyltransferase regulatory subunit [Nitratireductor sp.]
MSSKSLEGSVEELPTEVVSKPRAKMQLAKLGGEQELSHFFKARNCTMPHIGLLQPADPILNAAGEDIRRRIFMTADQGGKSFCLRPEFTIPVALRHIESGKTKGRYGYAGTVFRLREDEAQEFVQVGIEDIGAKNRIAADARCLNDCVETLRMLGSKKLVIATGDQAIFEAVLQSLGLPVAWQNRLARVFGDEKRLREDLDRLSGKSGDELAHLDEKLRAQLEAGDKEAVAKFVEKKMKAGGLSPQAGRTSEEITARLMQKAELNAVRLSADKRHALEQFLKLDMAIDKANVKLWSLARNYDIALGPALEVFHKRLAAIEKLQLENVSIKYRAGFGRRLDYYTGFVFEVRGAGKANAKPLAGGGRYDNLLNVLGSKVETPAIGYSVWVDRLPRGATAIGATNLGVAK